MAAVSSVLQSQEYIIFLIVHYQSNVLNSKIFKFFVLFKEVSSAHQACIYLIQSRAKTAQFWNMFTILIYF